MPDLLSVLANSNALKKVAGVPTTPGEYNAEIVLVAAADGQRALARWNGATWERYALPGEIARSGSPVGVITPIAIGILVRDTSATPNNLWVSTGLANTNWVQVGGGGSGGGAVEGTDVLSTGESEGLVLTSDGADGAFWAASALPVYEPGSLPTATGSGRHAILHDTTPSGLSSTQIVQDSMGWSGPPFWAKLTTISTLDIPEIPIGSAGTTADHTAQILRHRISGGLDTWWMSTDTTKATQLGGPLYPLYVDSPGPILKREYHGAILKTFGSPITLPDVDWVLSNSERAWWCEIFNIHPTGAAALVPAVPGRLDGATSVPPKGRVKVVQYRVPFENRWLAG